MVSRRNLLTGLAGLAAATVSLRGLAPAQASIATAAVAEPAVMAARVAPAEFAFIRADDELWTTGFRSRAEAVAAALKECEPGQTFEVADVDYYDLEVPPRPAEDVVNSLWLGEDVSGALLRSLALWNEDSDYEGEFAGSCEDGAEEITDEVHAAVAEAFRRQGRADLAADLLAGDCAPLCDDEVAAALLADADLELTLRSILRDFGMNHAEGLNGLKVGEVTKHQNPDASASAIPGVPPADAAAGCLNTAAGRPPGEA